MKVEDEVKVFGRVECHGKRLIVSQDFCGDRGTRFLLPKSKLLGADGNVTGYDFVKSQLVELVELVAGAADQVLSGGDGLWESWSLVVARAGGEVVEWEG